MLYIYKYKTFIMSVNIWVDKYKPKKLDDICGNKKACNEIIN